MSTEKTIEMNSVYVSRAKGDTVLQTDLYPQITVTEAISGNWFDCESSSFLEEFHLSALPVHKHESSFEVVSSRSSNRNSNRNSKSRLEIQNTDEPLQLEKQGYLQFEIRGWFSVEWVSKLVLLKNSMLYSSTDEKQTIIAFARFTSITSLRPVRITIDGVSEDVGFEFQANGVSFKLKANNADDRDEWVALIEAHIDQFKPIPLGDKLGLPALPRKSSQKNTTSKLISKLHYSTNIGPTTNWVSRLVILDNDLMINLFEPDAT